MNPDQPPSFEAVVVVLIAIFGIMAVILHDMSESIATDVVRHNSLSFLCPQK